MQIEILGSGGAITIPKPGCNCRVCDEARIKGVPYSRTGPSLFIHGPDILIDTPEEIKYQLNRAGIGHVKACIYSHWHPDHVMGRRVWEMNQDWLGMPPQHRRTAIYLPEQVAEDFRTHLETWNHLAFFEAMGLVRLVQLIDGDVLTLSGIHIRPFRLAAYFVYAFLLEAGTRRVLIAPDELAGWVPPSELRGLDLAILPMGVVEFNPLSGERQIPENHPVLRSEATYEQTLDIVRRLGARHTVLTHIEEPDGLSYGDLCRVEAALRAEGLNITFAYDTLRIDL